MSNSMLKESALAQLRDCSTIMGSSAGESALCRDLSEKNMRERFALAKRYTTRWSKARIDKIFYSDER